MRTELIVVLDVDTREDALRAVDACGECPFFKVGSQLFTRCGPAIVREIMDLGKKVFLDLKYHDIPNTVAKAAKAAFLRAESRRGDLDLEAIEGSPGRIARAGRCRGHCR